MTCASATSAICRSFPPGVTTVSPSRPDPAIRVRKGSSGPVCALPSPSIPPPGPSRRSRSSSDTELATFAPDRSAWAFASDLDIVSIFPVNTTVFPDTGLATVDGSKSLTVTGGSPSSGGLQSLSSTSWFCGSRKNDTISSAMLPPMPLMESRSSLASESGSTAASMDRHQFLQRQVVARQQPGGRFPDLANAQRVDESIEGNGSGAVDGIEQVARRRVSPSFPGGQRLIAATIPFFQGENIDGGPDQPFLVEQPDVLLAQPFDVEGVPRNEVQQPFLDLGLAEQPAGAVRLGGVLLPGKRASAYRAMGRERGTDGCGPDGDPSPPRRLAGSRPRRAG